MPKNILIFSDGTGQAGGLTPDQDISNIYKLYRATRCGPENDINPREQLTFYDPGLGKLKMACSASPLLRSAVGRDGDRRRARKHHAPRIRRAGARFLMDCPVFVVKISGDVRSMLSSIRRNAAVQGIGTGGASTRPRPVPPMTTIFMSLPQTTVSFIALILCGFIDQ
jgi:T6SS, Phospholipase effector Tle1-like, catalytic domain